MNKLLMRITVVGGLACGSALALASAPLKPSQLASSRGGADTTTAISDARLNATVTNNTATNVSSGNNTIDSGSFANMSSLPMVIQNSGANVLIQNADQLAAKMMVNTPYLASCLAWALALATPAVHAIELSAASGMRMVVPLKTLKQVRFDATVRQQYDFSCGSAALATLLSHHYGVRVTEQEAVEQMFRDGDKAKIRQQGFSLLDMQRFLATRGLRGDGFELALEKLAESKLPAIVLVADKGYNHFVVIKGVANGRVLLGDPSSGARAVSLDQFREMWTNKLLFVIHAYTGEVAFNRSADWRVAPIASLSEGLARASLDNVSLPKFGPGDF